MDSFTIYREYYELITLLSEKEQQELLLAIIKYMFEDIEPVLNDKQNKIFSNLKRPLDKSKNKGKNGSKTKSKQNQNEIKLKSKQNQNEIKQETHQDVNVNVNVNGNVNNNIFEYLEENYGRTLSPIEYEKIENWLKEYSEEIIKYAIEKSVLNNSKKINYVEAILNNWKTTGYKTLKEIKADETKPKYKPTDNELFDYDWLNEK